MAALDEYRPAHIGEEIASYPCAIVRMKKPIRDRVWLKWPAAMEPAGGNSKRYLLVADKACQVKSALNIRKMRATQSDRDTRRAHGVLPATQKPRHL